MISITGDKAIDNILRHLPEAVDHRVMSAANFRAARHFVDAEKLLAPEGPNGYLVDSIGAIKVPLRRASEKGEVIVGPRRKGGFRGFTGHLNEFGTKTRTNKRGANRGRMPIQKFAEPAFKQKVGIVQREIPVDVAKSLLRTMRRYNRA